VWDPVWCTLEQQNRCLGKALRCIDQEAHFARVPPEIQKTSSAKCLQMWLSGNIWKPLSRLEPMQPSLSATFGMRFPNSCYNIPRITEMSLKMSPKNCHVHGDDDGFHFSGGFSMVFPHQLENHHHLKTTIHNKPMDGAFPVSNTARATHLGRRVVWQVDSRQWPR